MKKTEVSVIIPVYNVERYLEQCVRSVMNQTMHDLEIICIDDGSKDHSLDILRKLENEDKRIVVIEKQNTGYGDTINTGILLAKGKYIGIIESDDFAEYDMYEKLYNAAEIYQADVTKGNFYEYQTSTGKKIINEYLQYVEYDCLMTNEDWLLLLGPTIWCGLYRKDFLIQKKIWLLPSSGASYQDTSFAFKVMYAAERVTFIKDAILNYRCDNVNSSVKSDEKIFCIKDEMDEAKRFLLEQANYEKDLPIFSRVKYLRYKWNLDRLHGEAKEIWREFMKKEFVEDNENGYLLKEQWFDWDWEFIQDMINS